MQMQFCIPGFCTVFLCFLSLWAVERSSTEQSLIQQRRSSPINILLNKKFECIDHFIKRCFYLIKNKRFTMSFEWMSTLLYWGIHTFKKRPSPLVTSGLLRSALKKRCKTFIKRKRGGVEHPVLKTQVLQLWQLRAPFFVFFLKSFRSLMNTLCVF